MKRPDGMVGATMDAVLKEIPARILVLAKGALSQANTHAAFADPGNEHWDFISVTNTAHAGELFIKAIIATEHPLLIFRDIFGLDDNRVDAIELTNLIRKGKTHEFEKLPQVLWVTTGQRIPDAECFDRLRRARNSIQHFCAPENEDFRWLSLQFIYSIIDPLIFKNFGLFAIDYHEDHSVGYDYLVGTLLRHELRFSIPDDFSVGEIRIEKEVERANQSYRKWLSEEMARIGRSDLFSC